MGSMIAMAKISDEYVTAADAQAALGLRARSSVMRKIKRGELVAEDVHGRFMITKKSLAAHLKHIAKNPRKIGRPAGAANKPRDDA